jgi:hypothetical protein
MSPDMQQGRHGAQTFQLRLNLGSRSKGPPRHWISAAPSPAPTASTKSDGDPHRARGLIKAATLVARRRPLPNDVIIGQDRR